MCNVRECVCVSRRRGLAYLSVHKIDGPDCHCSEVSISVFACRVKHTLAQIAKILPSNYVFTRIQGFLNLLLGGNRRSYIACLLWFLLDCFALCCSVAQSKHLGDEALTHLTCFVSASESRKFWDELKVSNIMKMN